MGLPSALQSVAHHPRSGRDRGLFPRAAQGSLSAQRLDLLARGNRFSFGRCQLSDPLAISAAIPDRLRDPLRFPVEFFASATHFFDAESDEPRTCQKSWLVGPAFDAADGGAYGRTI